MLPVDWSVTARIAAVMLLSAAIASPAGAQTLKVNTFPNAKSLPDFVGIAKGFFAKYGLTVEVEHTESSQAQRDGLAAGRFQIAQAALDNAVAMIEVAKRDVVIVSGGDSGMNEFMVQPGIGSFADLKGKTLIVDAPDTAYALQAKKLLLRSGLVDGRDYTVKPIGAVVFRYKAMISDPSNAASILNLPFTVEAKAKGLKSLGGMVDLLGPYQASGAFVMRPWAREHGAELEKYLAAYIQSVRWIRDPAHRAEAVDLMIDKLKLDREIAEQTYDLLIDPVSGFTPDANSTSKVSATCWRCAPRSSASRGRRRWRRSAMSTCIITTRRRNSSAARDAGGRAGRPQHEPVRARPAADALEARQCLRLRRHPPRGRARGVSVFLQLDGGRAADRRHLCVRRSWHQSLLPSPAQPPQLRLPALARAVPRRSRRLQCAGTRRRIGSQCTASTTTTPTTRTIRTARW